MPRSVRILDKLLTVISAQHLLLYLYYCLSLPELSPKCMYQCSRHLHDAEINCFAQAEWNRLLLASINIFFSTQHSHWSLPHQKLTMKQTPLAPVLCVSTGLTAWRRGSRSCLLEWMPYACVAAGKDSLRTDLFQTAMSCKEISAF